MNFHTHNAFKWPFLLGLPALALCVLFAFIYTPTSSSPYSHLLNPLLGASNYRLEAHKGVNESLSLALIIDETKQPSSEKLEEIKLALKAASGFSPARGDILRVSILPFSRPNLSLWGLFLGLTGLMFAVMFFLKHKKAKIKAALPFEKPPIQPKTLDDYVQDKHELAAALLRHWLKEETSHA